MGNKNLKEIIGKVVIGKNGLNQPQLKFWLKIKELSPGIMGINAKSLPKKNWNQLKEFGMECQKNGC